MAALCPPVPPAPDTPLSSRDFLHAVRTNVLAIWPRSAYRDPLTVHKFVGRTQITLADADAIRRVLIDNAANYRRSPASIRILRPVAGQGLLLSQGKEWKLQRRTTAPALSPRVMPLLAAHVVGVARDAIVKLKAGAGHPVDLLAAVQRLALDIAGRSMFSLEMDRHGALMRRMLTAYGETYARPRLLDMLLPSALPAPLDWGRMLFRRRWMGLIGSLIAERLAEPQPEAPRDLFDLLRAARDPETGAGFSAAQLRDQVATLLLAGHETTAVTLFWALVLLAQAPAEQAWLFEEAAAVELTPDGAFGMTDRLPRTRAVINETLRLFPPAFALVRQAIGPDRLAGAAIPNRTLVMIPPWVLHRHHDHWEDPMLFKPERFMPDRPAPARFAFMPFGAGPRACVGAQLAVTEVVLVLASLIRHFRVARVDNRPVLPVGIVTLQPDHPARVTLTVRD